MQNTGIINSADDRNKYSAGEYGCLGGAEKLTYDKAAKNVLSNKVIVANILHAAVSELDGYTAKEIRSMLKSGVTDDKVACFNNEDAHSDMATVSFDVDIRLKDESIPLDIEIDIEPQAKLYPTYNNRKYSVYKRALYYACRMIVRQLGTGDNDYNKLHKCYSIWICFQNDGNSNVTMTRHSIKSLLKNTAVSEHCSEKAAQKAKQFLKNADLDIDLIEVIMIYVPKSYEKSDLDIQKFLYSIFYKHIDGIKEFISPDEWDIIESEVNTMGHLEAELRDMYLEQGIEMTKTDTVDQLIKLKLCSFDEALKVVKMRREDYERVKNSGMSLPADN